MAIAGDVYGPTTQASQYVKEIYAPRVVRLYPETNWLTKNISFNAANRLGKQYVVPIELAPEQGVTYGAPGSSSTTTALALNGAIGLATQDATLQPNQIVVQRSVDYESIQRTVGSKAAFVSFIDATLRSVVALATKRLELSIMHGQSATGLATISAVSGSSSGAGATRVVTITDAEWAGGIWGGMENALVDVYKSDGTTKMNTALNVQISAVDLVNKQLTLKVIAADATFLTNIDSYYSGAIIFPASSQATGSAPTVEMVGLDKICSNTGSLFGIDAATYGLWKGNSLTSWGAPSLGKILDAVSRLVERGLDEDVVFVCSPKHFARLNSDQTALRMYDQSFGTQGKNGFNSLKFQAAEGINVMVRGHRFCKDGYAFLLPMSKFMRVGTTELTFTNMGVDGDIFLQTAGYASVELRGYLGQALLCTAPSRTARISGVTYP